MHKLNAASLVKNTENLQDVVNSVSGKRKEAIGLPFFNEQKLIDKENTHFIYGFNPLN
jgi:hypothetical protein